MNATGENIVRFVQQTGNFSYRFLFSSPNTLEEFSFGLSGDGRVPFRIKNGKVYDGDNRFIAGVEPNSSFEFSGNVSHVTDDLFVNGVPTYIGRGRNVGQIDSFYFDARTTSVDYEFYLIGQRPNFEIQQFISYSSGENPTCSITNLSNFPFDISDFSISSSVYSPSGFPNSVSASGSGQLIFCPSYFQGGVQDVDITLQTNFGVVSETLQVSGITQAESNNFISISAETFNIRNKTTKEFYISYISEEDLFVGLEIISGSGIGSWNFFTGEDTDSYVDFRESGFSGENIFENINSLIPATGDENYIYTKISFDYTGTGVISNEVVRLYISGENTNISYDFSGTA